MNSSGKLKIECNCQLYGYVFIIQYSYVHGDIECILRRNLSILDEID